MSEIRNREFRLYICFFAAFFLLCLFISKPSANKKSGISLSYNCFFAATLFCFPFSFAMRPSFTVVFRQCSANCMQKQSIQHYPERTTTMMEQQKSHRADGAWGRSTGKNEKYSDPRELTHLGGGHRKIVYRHSEMAYIHRRQREAA